MRTPRKRGYQEVLSRVSSIKQFSYHYGGMQRLFSTFPNGWPGFGLLLLRLGVGIALISFGIGGFFAAAGEPIAVARDSIEAAGAILLIIGLWTPVVGTLIALDELWIAISVYSSPSDGHWNHIFLAVLTAGVAMLGPGAWSIDARLFGRKRFDMGDRNRDRKPSH
jgi:putative oxidoreductase